MKKVIKEIPGKSPLEWQPEESVAYTATKKHDPWKTVYIAWINPHGAYPTDTCIGYYDTAEQAEEAIKKHIYSQYGGYIEQSTWGDIERTIMF